MIYLNRGFIVRLTLSILVLGLTLCMASCAALLKGEPDEAAKQVAVEYYIKGKANLEEGRPEKASADLRAALDADPGMYHAYYPLGMAYRKMGKMDLARQTWEQGVQLVGQSAERSDYPRQRALAELRAALTGLEERPLGEAKARKPTPKKTAPQKKPAGSGSAMKAAGGYAVLYSSNLMAKNAGKDNNLLRAKGFDTMLELFKDKKGRTWHRVWVGCCGGRAEAGSQLKKLKAMGLGDGAIVMKPSR